MPDSTYVTSVLTAFWRPSVSILVPVVQMKKLKPTEKGSGSTLAGMPDLCSVRLASGWALTVKSSKVSSDGGSSYRAADAGEATERDHGPGLLQTGLSGRAPEKTLSTLRSEQRAVPELWCSPSGQVAASGRKGLRPGRAPHWFIRASGGRRRWL